MADQDIPLYGTLVPGGTFPTHEARFGKGGKIEVADLATRNSLPASRLTKYMFCTTQDTGITYQLISVSPAVWSVFSGSSGGGGALHWAAGTAFADLYAQVLALNLDGIANVTTDAVAGGYTIPAGSWIMGKLALSCPGGLGQLTFAAGAQLAATPASGTVELYLSGIIASLASGMTAPGDQFFFSFTSLATVTGPAAGGVAFPQPSTFSVLQLFDSSLAKNSAGGAPAVFDLQSGTTLLVSLNEGRASIGAGSITGSGSSIYLFSDPVSRGRYAAQGTGVSIVSDSISPLVAPTDATVGPAGAIERKSSTGYLQVSNGTSWGPVAPFPIVTSIKVANYTAVASDLVRGNPTGGTWVLTLPSGAAKDDTVWLKNVSDSETAITVTPPSGQTIDGQATFTADTPRGSWRFVFDGTSDWMVIW